MLKTFTYKLEPNRPQRLALEKTLDICREVWNLGLEQRKMQRMSPFAQMRELTELRQAFPKYKQVHVHVRQNVVKKLHRALERMGELGAGFPRFKSKQRYHSFSFNNTGFRLSGKHLQLSKIGNVKVRWSRPIAEGSVIKSLIVKQTASGWYACLAVDVAIQPLPQSDLAIGIDLGIENFAALSEGTMIPNPRFYEPGQDERRVAQRRVARRKKGSHRRGKAVVILKKIHEHIQNKRLDWMHTITTDLVNRFGTIVLENLQVKGWHKEYWPSKSTIADGANSSRYSNTRLKVLVGDQWKWMHDTQARNALLVELRKRSRCGNERTSVPSAGLSSIGIRRQHKLYGAGCAH